MPEKDISHNLQNGMKRFAEEMFVGSQTLMSLQ
jgi:hypothetical protein